MAAQQGYGGGGQQTVSGFEEQLVEVGRAGRRPSGPHEFHPRRLCFRQVRELRELITPLLEDFLRTRNDQASSWVLQHLAKQNSSTDKLKIPLLEAYNKKLSDYAPPASSDIEHAIKQLLGAESKSLRVATFPGDALREERVAGGRSRENKKGAPGGIGE
jgi:hypothetical protein